MDIKTFEGVTLRDAVKAVKKDLGPEAVILSTKEKLLANDPRTKVYEVTATASQQKTKKNGAYASDNHEEFHDLQNKMDQLLARVNYFNEKLPTRSLVQGLETGMHEIKLFLYEVLKDKLQDQSEHFSDTILNIKNQLHIMCVDQVYIQQAIHHLANLPFSSDKEGTSEKEFYRNNLIRWMLKRIHIAPKFQPQERLSAIHCILGGSGVGKTSIVAKLAAHYHLKEKHKVLLISFDNHRIAANEQLRVYAKLIGGEFETMYKPDDLVSILDKHKDCPLVFIDTAGKNPKNTADVAELLELKETNLPIDFHLVLSCTEKESQHDRTVRQFSPLGISSLIFSKLDASWSYGEIFNLTTRWSLPLSYFSLGPAIPDDFERASKEKVVEQILGV